MIVLAHTLVGAVSTATAANPSMAVVQAGLTLALGIALLGRVAGLLA